VDLGVFEDGKEMEGWKDGDPIDLIPLPVPSRDFYARRQNNPPISDEESHVATRHKFNFRLNLDLNLVASQQHFQMIY